MTPRRPLFTGLLPLCHLLVALWTSVLSAQVRLPQEPNDVEQLIIYELNRARNNPARFAQENGLSVDLSGVAPQPPLAVNNALVGSASFHAEEMAAFDYFAHQSAVTGDFPNKVARDHGYVLPDFYLDGANNIESIAGGTFLVNAVDPLSLLIEDEGLDPPGHRIQLLAMASFFQTHREIGAGFGFNAAATLRNYYAIQTAVSPGRDQFLTGVVYNDANGNGRYDLGEGLGGVAVGNGVQMVSTNAAGGWSILVGPGTQTVTASGGGFSGLAAATVTVTSNNVEIDFVSGNQSGQVDFSATGQTVIVAAVLPGSRSVSVGTSATAFATIINAGQTMALGCGIAPLTSVSATFVYQATNPATNEVIGVANALVDIPAGATAQSFVFALTPTAPIPPTDVQLQFDCGNSGPAAVNPGLNTLLLSASSTPIPDIVALAATVNNDGIVRIPGATGTGVFAVATVNVGAGGAITVSADTGAATLPVNVAVCETNPATGACLTPVGSSVTRQIDANATPTFGIFVVGTGLVPFDPAANRIFVRFKDADGVTRGSTSVAVRTQ